MSVLWIGFVLLWWKVLRNTLPDQFVFLLAYFVSALIVYGTVVAFWILHNLRIYRVKGPRKNTRHLTCDLSHDYLNRTLVIDVRLQEEQDIVVDLAEGAKRYTRAPGAFSTALAHAAATFANPEPEQEPATHAELV